MKINIEKLDEIYNVTAQYFWMLLVSFFSVMAFVLGGLALLILMKEGGHNPFAVILSFKIAIVLMKISCGLIALKILLVLMKKFVIPFIEKDDKRKSEEFDDLVKLIIRKELKAKRKKK